jgi:membrane dipeptidase
MHLKYFALLAAASLAACTPSSIQTPTPVSDPFLARALNVLRTTPLIDGHNDLPWEIRTNKGAEYNVDLYDLRVHSRGMTDIDRLRAGHAGAQFWSVYIPGDLTGMTMARAQAEQIDIAKRIIAKYPDVFVEARSAADIRRAFADKKIGSLIGMEGGHAIENSLALLRMDYDLGARYMTLTHNVTLDWADAALGAQTHGGLTAFGKEVVREMNRLGMLVDLSHVSPATMSDALDVSEAPVIFSHSAARALVDHARNVPDSILRRLPANGGVVMVTFVPGFVSPEFHDFETRADAYRATLKGDSAVIRAGMQEWSRTNPRPKATLAQVADHIEHVRKIAGPDHVGIGSDFDGITATPEGLEDVSKFPALFAELARRGWSDADLRKLAGENILRAFERAEAVAAGLQKTRGPSIASIEMDKVSAR